MNNNILFAEAICEFCSKLITITSPTGKRVITLHDCPSLREWSYSMVSSPIGETGGFREIADYCLTELHQKKKIFSFPEGFWFTRHGIEKEDNILWYRKDTTL